MVEWWQTVLLALATGCVPGIILWALNRKGANKQLQLQEGGLSVTQFNAQTQAYQDLLDRANATIAEQQKALTEANLNLTKAVQELKAYQEEREDLIEKVDDQGKQLDATNRKIEVLRELLTSYVERVGVPMTTEELAIFEETKPTRSGILRSQRRK